MFDKIRLWFKRRQNAADQKKTILTLMRACNYDHQVFVETFRQIGCRIIHLSRNRVLITDPSGKAQILVTEECVILNPAEKSF